MSQPDLSPMFLPETESAVLATLVASPDQAMPWAGAHFHPEDFFDKANRDLFRLLLVMSAENSPITFPTLCSAIQSAGMAAQWAPARLSDLIVRGGLPTSLPHLCAELREKRALRALYDGIVSAGGAVLEPGAKSGEVIERLQGIIEQASKARSAAKPAPTMKELVMTTIERIQKRYNGETDEVGFSTGLKSLDAETGGLRPGSTWVLAGEQKGGKSTLAANMLESLAVHDKQRCLFFGLEMPAIENVERMIASNGNVRASLMRDGTVSDDDLTRINAAAIRLASAPIHFRDDIFDLSELMAVARQTKLAHPDLFAVFVDYAQLVSAGRRDNESREQEVAAVSVALRRFAMQEKVCVVVLSQLNDEGKLRESRRLGMDATTVAIIEHDDEEGVKRLRLIQRNGRRVTLRVAYRGDYVRFDDLAEGDRYPTDSQPEKKPAKQQKAWRNYHQ